MSTVDQLTYRTDRNNNPAAVTTAVAALGLTKGVDYVDGDPFPAPSTLVTAKFLGDPIATTIKLIDAAGYKTKLGTARWTYICLPAFIWHSLTADQKRDVVGYHYEMEGGKTMKSLFPNYGQR